MVLTTGSDAAPPCPAPWGGAIGASLGGRSRSADSALNCRRNCRNRPGRTPPRREPKESEVSLAEPLRGSLRCPSSGHAGADSGGSPAKSRGGSSSDLSPVRLLAGRWATVGRTGRRDRERLKPSPGSECQRTFGGAGRVHAPSYIRAEATAASRRHPGPGPGALPSPQRGRQGLTEGAIRIRNGEEP